MINLTEINKTKRAYADIEHELLFLGIFKDKKLNPKQRYLDASLENRLSDAVELDPLRLLQANPRQTNRPHRRTNNCQHPATNLD